MAKIILPTYVTKLPSSGKSVSFRPFTVKEEKALLLALQEADVATVTSAIKNLVRACTDDSVNPSSTPYYDIEFLFLKIRSKSVGEMIEMVGRCECDPQVETSFAIDIDSMAVLPEPSGNKKVKILDTPYTIVFTHPTLDDFASTMQPDTNHAEKTVANCIVSVFTEDEVMDWSFEEKLEFVESMTTRQQKEIAQFLKDMPMVKLPIAYSCKSCGKQHNRTLSGFENFFV